MARPTRFELIIPDDLKQAMADEAVRDNRSMAQVVILALRQYLSPSSQAKPK